ncbi:MAG TPA: hypothetical protein PKA64_09815 [Myxococcota bacterium]|nr:hypothetical protein [Myxococcota bacterium]
MVQLLIVLAAALICMGTGWWIGYRSRTTTTTLVLEPWPEDGEPLEPGSRDTQLEAARIAAANARHGLKEATEEADRSRKELEQLRVRADDREAKLRVTERMLSQVQEARVAAVNAQIAAEERLNAVRLEASTHAASADGELRRLRAEVGARDRQRHCI